MVRKPRLRLEQTKINRQAVSASGVAFHSRSGLTIEGLTLRHVPPGKRQVEPAGTLHPGENLIQVGLLRPLARSVRPDDRPHRNPISLPAERTEIQSDWHYQSTETPNG